MRKWLRELVADPDGSPSSTRISALLCTVTACFVAVYGVATKTEQSGTVTGLLAGAAGMFFTRRKSEGTGDAAS